MKFRLLIFTKGILLFSFLLAQSVYAGKTRTTAELKDAIVQMVAYSKEMAALENEGKTVEAKEIREKYRKLKKEFLYSNTTYVTSPDCLLVSGRSGGIGFISLSCWPTAAEDDFSFKEHLPVVEEFNYVLAGDLMRGFDPKNQRKYQTSDKIGKSLQAAAGQFKGKFQIGVMNMSRNILVKVLSVEK